MTYLTIGSRALLFGVFIVAAVGKVRGRAAFAAFAASVRTLRLLPGGWSAAAAAAVAVIEGGTLLLLALPSTVHLGFGLAVGLLAVFTMGILASMRRGQRVPCRCFGASGTPMGPVHVIRNLALMMAGAVGLVASLVAGQGGGPAHPGGVAVALTVAVVGVVLVVRLDDLMGLFKAPVSTPSTGGAATE